MTEQFETWLEHEFDMDFNDVVDFIAQLDKLDILSKSHTMQALRDRYEDACNLAEADYWDQGEWMRERRADLAQYERERAQEMNKENGW